MLKRHTKRGQVLQNFEFPAKQGMDFQKNTEATEYTLAKYANSAANQRYARRIKLKMTNPDQEAGFKDQYLSGTHISYGNMTQRSKNRGLRNNLASDGFPSPDERPQSMNLDQSTRNKVE